MPVRPTSRAFFHREGSPLRGPGPCPGRAGSPRLVPVPPAGGPSRRCCVGGTWASMGAPASSGCRGPRWSHRRSAPVPPASIAPCRWTKTPSRWRFARGRAGVDVRQEGPVGPAGHGLQPRVLLEAPQAFTVRHRSLRKKLRPGRACSAPDVAAGLASVSARLGAIRRWSRPRGRESRPTPPPAPGDARSPQLRSQSFPRLGDRALAWRVPMLEPVRRGAEAVHQFPHDLAIAGIQ